MSVDVSSEFAEIGFSGVFHLEASMVMADAEVERWRAKVPCLLRNSGWMALQVVGRPPRMLLVRRDADALVETFTRGTRTVGRDARAGG